MKLKIKLYKVPKLPVVGNLMEMILKGIHSNQDISKH